LRPDEAALVEHVVQALRDDGWTVGVAHVGDVSFGLSLDHPLSGELVIVLKRDESARQRNHRRVENVLEGPEVAAIRAAPRDCIHHDLMRSLRLVARARSWHATDLRMLSNILVGQGILTEDEGDWLWQEGRASW